MSGTRIRWTNRCISIDTSFPDYCDIGYKFVALGRYSFRVFLAPMTDEWRWSGRTGLFFKGRERGFPAKASVPKSTCRLTGILSSAFPDSLLCASVWFDFRGDVSAHRRRQAISLRKRRRRPISRRCVNPSGGAVQA